jgi:hypothetical protein
LGTNELYTCQINSYAFIDSINEMAPISLCCIEKGVKNFIIKFRKKYNYKTDEELIKIPISFRPSISKNERKVNVHIKISENGIATIQLKEIDVPNNIKEATCNFFTGEKSGDFVK